MPSINPGPASSSTVNSFEIASQVPNPPGDQSQISRDSSILREGSTSLATSGDLFNLVGDQVMKYWTHNFGIDQNGFFLGRDDSGAMLLDSHHRGLRHIGFHLWPCIRPLALRWRGVRPVPSPRSIRLI